MGSEMCIRDRPGCVGAFACMGIAPGVGDGVVVMRIGPAVCGGDGRVRVGACGSEPGGSRGCRNACSDSSGGGLYRGRYGVCVAVVRATRGRPSQLVNRD
mgnify:CR=1 FL=1